MGEKLHEVESNNVAALNLIETEIQYSGQYEVIPMNRGRVACSCHLTPLSGKQWLLPIVFG